MVYNYFCGEFRNLPKEKKAGAKVTMGFPWKNGPKSPHLEGEKCEIAIFGEWAPTSP
jgi:hypothetical protein